MDRRTGVIALVAAASAWTAIVAGPVGAAPANDDVADAVEIGDLPFRHAVDLADSSVETGEADSACGGSGEMSVWYRYTAPADGRVVLRTRGSDFDTVLSVWTGAAHPLDEVVCSDDIGFDAAGAYEDLSSAITLTVRAATTMLVRADGYPEAGTPAWNLVLTAETAAFGPANDDLAGATIIDALPFADHLPIRTAGLEVGEEAASCAGRLPSGVWYRHTPRADTRLRLDSEGSDVGVVLSIWVGTDHPLTEVGCTLLDPLSDTDDSLNLHLAAGRTYFIKAEGWFQDGTDTAGLSLRAATGPSGPPGDDLADAIAIDSLPSTHEGSVLGASVEPGEVAPSCHPFAQHAVWFIHTPPADGRLRLDLAGSAAGIGLSIWTGRAHPLTEVACQGLMDAGRALTLNVVGGVRYAIRVAGFRSEDGTLTLHATTAEPGPPGDDLADAIEIDALPYARVVDTTAAGIEPYEAPSGCGDQGDHGVWFRISSATATRVLLDTRGSNFDTVLSVWSGTRHPLDEETCTDDSEDGDPRAELAVALTAGATYYIRAGGFDGSSGQVDLRVLPPPGNDDPTDARAIDALPYTDRTDTRLATDEPRDLGGPCGRDAGHGVWYRHQPAADGRLRLDTRGSSYDTVVSVWVPRADGLDAVACEDNVGGGGPLSSLTLAVRTGTTYFVGVEGQGDTAGALVLNAALALPGPANDDLASAAAIDGLPFVHRVDSGEAGWEPGEAAATCGIDPGHGVWYRFAGARAGRLRLDTVGTMFDTVVSVWTGTDHPLSPVACGDDIGGGDAESSLTLSMPPDLAYFIKVDGASSRGGPLVFRAAEPPPGPANDDLAQAHAIPALPFVHAVEAIDAGQEPGEAMARCPGASGRGVWYRYRPAVRGEIEVEAAGANVPAIVSVWQGMRHPLVPLGCWGKDASGSNDTPRRVTVSPSDTYYIRVEALAGHAGRLGVRVTGTGGPDAPSLALPWLSRRAAR